MQWKNSLDINCGNINPKITLRECVFMAFKTRKKEDFFYSSPQEMYQDNKLKKIMGPLRLSRSHA